MGSSTSLPHPPQNDSMTVLQLSLPRYLQDRQCGYCHLSKPDYFSLESRKQHAEDYPPPQSIIIGTHVFLMSCRDYDEFINQGYRRSGSFMYKPDQLRTCCRQFTIRTNIEYLGKLNKEQRKVINRFIKEICPNGMEPPKKHAEFDYTRLIKAQQGSKRFRTRFEPSKFSKEKYELYKKYQMKVHGDKESEVHESSFKRFLCDTPFSDEEINGNESQWELLQNWVKNWNPDHHQTVSGENKRIGPTHELYYLDDKLIAFSVLDFLPTGLSSIYFVWDPDYAHLSLGTLSALKEIQMCHELGLGYYYLGYYIEDCPKMVYKGKFGGEILDIVNETYFPMEIIKPYISGDRLFVMGEEDKLDEYSQELEIENDGYPIDVTKSRFKDKKLTNVAENIYGNPEVEKRAEEAAKTLLVKYGIYYDFDDVGGEEIPMVVPGITPLWQIVEWFETGVLDEDFPIRFYYRYNKKRMSLCLGDLTDQGKALVINCIRMFGIEKVERCEIAL